jgi:hypothetical protein
MSKVRVEHEDVFIRNIESEEEIPGKYHFDFNSNWVSNNSSTKRICVRKIEVFPMTFTAGAGIGFRRPNHTHFLKNIMFTLTGNKIITDYLDYLELKINEYLYTYYSNNNYIVSYVYSKTNLAFIASIEHNNNPNSGPQLRISFFGYAIKIFNITDDIYTIDYLNENNYIKMSLPNISPGHGKYTVEIMLDTDSALAGHPPNNDGHNIYIFNIWDKIKLFLHSSFSISMKDGYVCEVGESYHKLAKKYPMFSDSFDIWFTIDGKKIVTPEIDSFILELSFLE